ncbi:glucose-6-phosphate exchanger SLC37A2-like isoform X2 [Gigantopelta aegis]|uniref:glucose-6-phosphate exchanger SLC37A2-like isoform X2 n=1 Tax=Gigantopelta aegis TaxID=1735272 RepID=UPI001B88C911|nr:glucose-6-phosphate exchanger SLC37A2-like isoform X2 [Gigantopelta aegis]
MSVPWGIRILPNVSRVDRNVTYRIFIIIFTFLVYTSYHMSRKPISVVKSVLNQNCTYIPFPIGKVNPNNTKWCDWAPFDKSNSGELLGSLDYAYLFAYAISMFISGHVAERISLRYFLTFGMLGSGLLTAAFGMGYFWNIHSFSYYIVVQAIGGMFQSTGWPSVVACMGNWYGKGKRGLIMGIWNSHTSVGNILGSIIPGIFADHAWGWCFIVPGIIICSMGILVFFFLVPRPEDVGCRAPDHQGTGVVAEDKSIDVEAEAGSTVVNSVELPLLANKKKHKAITLWSALKIPGVLEFALCLFFAKLVSYTFLFWLPKYISARRPEYTAKTAADLSTFFDIGGIAGGIVAGVISDRTGARASTCMVMLLLAAPMMYVYDLYGSVSYAQNAGLLLLCGSLVNGPYALITTAVSADLGTHKSLQGNSRALATVTAIIDGTGSIGAALGPLFTGLIYPTGWNNVFWMLIAADLAALLFLGRLVTKEVASGCDARRKTLYDKIDDSDGVIQ